MLATLKLNGEIYGIKREKSPLKWMIDKNLWFKCQRYRSEHVLAINQLSLTICNSVKHKSIKKKKSLNYVFKIDVH